MGYGLNFEKFYHDNIIYIEINLMLNFLAGK